jgi:hypothetical protein
MWPQNLANPSNYKAGYTSKEIYRSFANRLDGTVMPTFSANTLDPEDPVHGEYLQWALAAYVSDQVRSRAGMTDARKVVARQLSGNLPSDPSDPAWEQIPMRVVPLSGQVLVPPRWSAPSVSQVAIRVVFNSTAMAVWLRWDDRRPNVVHEEPSVDFAAASDPMLGPATYAAPALKPKSPVVFNARDQLELQLPDPAIEQRALQDRPQFFYGSEQAPVRLWRWSADRQGLKVTKRVEEIAGAKAERFECTSETPERNEGAIDLLIARGLAQIEPVSNGPVIRSRADWSNGAWTLVLSGSLVEPQQLLSDRRALPIAIHLWDGLAGETGLRMAISSWIDIVAASPRPIWQHAVAVVLAALVLIGLLMLARRMRLHFSLSGRASDG